MSEKQNPDRTPIDMIFDGVKEITTCSNDLAGIANALERVGLDKLAKELFEISQSLTTSAHNIRKGYGMEINNSVRRADEMSGLLLKATLHGAFTKGTGTEAGESDAH